MDETNNTNEQLEDLVISVIRTIGGGRMVRVSSVVNHDTFKATITTSKLSICIDGMITSEKLIREKRGVVSLPDAPIPTITNTDAITGDWDVEQEEEEKEEENESKQTLTWHLKQDFVVNHTLTFS